MKLQEAIVEAQRTGCWFRPVYWKCGDIAVCIGRNNVDLDVVPTLNGGGQWIPSVGAILADWETITPDELYAEMKEVEG